VVFANGHVAVRGSLEAAQGVVERLSGHDPPLPGILPAEIWEVHPRSGETDDHQLLVETYAAAAEGVNGSSDGEPLVQRFEPRRVNSRRAVSKTPAAAGAGVVGVLVADEVVELVVGFVFTWKASPTACIPNRGSVASANCWTQVPASVDVLPSASACAGGVSSAAWLLS
jgi:hypothetical protein